MIHGGNNCDRGILQYCGNQVTVGCIGLGAEGSRCQSNGTFSLCIRIEGNHVSGTKGLGFTKVLQCQCAVIVHYCCAIEVGTKLVESQHRIVIADNDLAGGVICVSGTSDFHMQGNGFTHRHIGFIGFQPCI